MNTEYPYGAIENLNPQEKCSVFKKIAENFQKGVINYLKSLPSEKAEVIKQFWISVVFILKRQRM
ncbi:MAG: hypothetical protein N3A65_08435 [candidate division WOR-3 bacterium]|nr:hypothetical protein [candidate division WOR-3 bacterium]